jgi:glycosyltransferase involved in cell wall biosynthesis
LSSPFVTVLIDTYNYGHFIDQAIESVLSQDFPPDQMEVLVIDDGSTDDTAARVKKYGPRVQYFCKTNGGQASAFNFGFAKARGEIIAILDADDYWFSDRLSTVVAEFEKHAEAGMVYHPLREFHVETGEYREAVYTPISGFVPSSIKQLVLFDGVMTTSSYRREILAQLLPIPETLRIQADAYIGSLAVFLAPVICIGRPLGIYRIHGKNLYFQAAGVAETKRLLRRIETRREIVKGMTEWFVLHGYDTRQPEVRVSLTKWVLLLERDEFQLSPPGRIRFFRHLMKAYRQQSPLMTRRIRAVNCFNAVGVLIVGYGKFHALDENRERITRWLRHAVGLRHEKVRLS